MKNRLSLPLCVCMNQRDLGFVGYGQIQQQPQKSLFRMTVPKERKKTG